MGEGAKAQGRADLARSAGAEVSRLVPAEARVEDFRGASAAFVATGDLESDTAAQRLAKQAGVPVNVADRPALCDFILPAIVDRDEVVVAISTGGTSPTLATVAAWPHRSGAAAAARRAGAAGRRPSGLQVNALIADPAAAARSSAVWSKGRRGVLRDAGRRGRRSSRRADAISMPRVRRQVPQGVAHIVGAGPGNPRSPDARTPRSFLQEADAILHDDLGAAGSAGAGALDAEFVSVGKDRGRPSWAQADIERRAVRRVAAGHDGGSPEGRRSLSCSAAAARKSMHCLRAAGLAYTIVPGITAALGCAASAGIPLTHRRIASAVTFVSGHSALGAKQPAWAALAAEGHTLAI